MAPEVYRQEVYSETADVFSFAIMMYELLHRYMMISATDGSFEECQVGRQAGSEGGQRGAPGCTCRTSAPPLTCPCPWPGVRAASGARLPAAH